MKSLLAGLLAAVSISASAEALSPCRVAGLRHEALCGQLQRALDPARPAGLKITLHYVVVPALARHKLSDPVVFLAGGPGQSATALASSVLPLFSRLNNRRDIVFIDQRGTGRSAPLTCNDDEQRRGVAEQADPERQLKGLLQCRARLIGLPHVGSAEGLKFFTTALAVQDIDAVRQALGADQVNLVGGSYGTRVALEYQRQFPARVRRSVLDGVAPPDMGLPASISTDAQAVFEAMLNACAREVTCLRAHPHLRQDWASLLASVPRRVTVAHPLNGEPEHFTLTRDVLLGAVRGSLYSPALAAALPAAIDEAARGRLQGLLTLNSMMTSRRALAPAMGMHFSVICAEDIPRLGGSTDLPGSDFGDAQARLYQQVCAEWPRGEVPAGFYSVTGSASPVLLLSGGLDPATPPRHGLRMAAELGAKARHVVVDNAGHGVMSIGCSPDVLYRFIAAEDDKTALAVDTGCLQGIPRPPAFLPLRFTTGDPR